MAVYQLPCIVKPNWRPPATVAILVTLVCVGAACTGVALKTVGLMAALGYCLPLFLWMSHLAHQLRFEVEGVVFRNSDSEIKQVLYQEIKRIEVKKAAAFRGGTHYRVELLDADADESAEHFALVPFEHTDAALIINTLAAHSGASLNELAAKIGSGEIKAV